MCLATISLKKPKPEGFGYKVVMPRKDGKYKPSYCGSFIYSINKWYKAKPHKVKSQEGKNYTTGFHILLNRKAADWILRIFPDEVLVRVKYRGARILGDGGYDDDQVIADEMMIVKVYKPKVKK